MDANGTAGFAALIIGMLIYFVVLALIIVTTWKLYRKANKPGWASIVPVYNYVVLLEIVGRPIWWILLSFVPLVNVYVAFVVALDLAKSFGKSTGFGVANFFVPFITYPILAFSKNARYAGPIAEGLDSFAPAPDRAPTPSATVQGQPVPPVADDTAAQPMQPGAELPATPPVTPSAEQPQQTSGDQGQPRPPQF
jgi:hypothetical protein